MTDCPECQGTGIRESKLDEASLVDALVTIRAAEVHAPDAEEIHLSIERMVQDIKDEQTARAQAYIKRATRMHPQQAIDFLRELKEDYPRSSPNCPKIEQVINLLLTMAEALAIKDLE